MISPERRRAAWIIVAGLLLKFGSPTIFLTGLAEPTRTWLFLVPYLLGTVTYLWGCGAYAVAKHRHRAWGCTGLFCVLALPFLIRLKPHQIELTSGAHPIG
jgi:hypothetical protein